MGGDRGEEGIGGDWGVDRWGIEGGILIKGRKGSMALVNE